MNPFQHRTGWGKRDEYGPVPRLWKLLSFGVVDDLGQKLDKVDKKH